MRHSRAYNEQLEQRVRRYFELKRMKPETKPMRGGLCFMVNGKRCVGIEKERLMARIGPDCCDEALKRKGCRPMDFTGRPMRGFVFVYEAGWKSPAALKVWLDGALAFHPKAEKSAKKKRQTK